MTGQEYMQMIQKNRREIRMLLEQIERDSTIATGVRSATFTSSRVQSSRLDDRLTDITSRILTSTEHLKQRIKTFQDAENEARQLLVQLKDERERVLTYRYFDGMNMTQIADKLNYSYGHVYEVHNKALDDLTELLNRSGKTA